MESRLTVVPNRGGVEKRTAQPARLSALSGFGRPGGQSPGLLRQSEFGNRVGGAVKRTASYLRIAILCIAACSAPHPVKFVRGVRRNSVKGNLMAFHKPASRTQIWLW